MAAYTFCVTCRSVRNSGILRPKLEKGSVRMSQKHAEISAQFDVLCGRVRQQLVADRVTLRLDLPEYEINVNRPCGESTGSTAPSLRDEGGLDQRALETVKWLASEARPLVQDDFSSEPHPPEALRSIYKVRAQMLYPVYTRFPTLIGWLSVHQLVERRWTAEDLSHCYRVVAEIDAVLAGRESNA